MERSSQLLMGNEAIGLGALHAGVRLVSGYPGTPSTEVLETVARHNPGHVHVEWSINEKAALEVAAGAAYAGARVMVTMKQVGLNVASDPLMSLNYVGVKGGMVLVVADDPGPISSQTEQDTRHFGRYARLPVLDPSSPEEAYAMVSAAFELSEAYRTPVILRPTTRVCHACASVVVGETPPPAPVEGFRKGKEWVIFPRLSFESKKRLVAREPVLAEAFSASPFNAIEGEGPLGVVCGGISYAYVKEALSLLNASCRLLKVNTPYPFPETLARRFLEGLERVLVIEELDPVLEDALVPLTAGRIPVQGKRDGTMPSAGENTVALIAEKLRAYLGLPAEQAAEALDLPELPMRPPVLCAGCPHRASFYAVKRAMRGKKAVFCGDIGCYTLGNAAPLDMVDTCLCMGAGITVAHGLQHVEPDAVHFAFVGDSTFFHTGIPGVINAVYNGADMILAVLDNATTAMTGHQPHPGMGRRVSGNPAEKISIVKILEAIGVSSLRRVNPFDQEQTMAAVKAAARETGVRALVFEAPCIVLVKDSVPLRVNAERCIGCKRCIHELGCPALSMRGGKAVIEASLCTGCGLCATVCPKQCMEVDVP